MTAPARTWTSALTGDWVWWRDGGIAFVVTCLVAGRQAKIGALVDTLVVLSDGERGGIPFPRAPLGLCVLGLLGFAAALASTLRYCRAEHLSASRDGGQHRAGWTLDRVHPRLILPVAVDGIPLVRGLRRRRDPVRRAGDPSRREPGGVADYPLAPRSRGAA